MAEYTPGPWLVHEWGEGCTIVEAQVRVSEAPGLHMQGQKVLAQKLTRANAEFIVLAVNAYEDLLAALEAVADGDYHLGGTCWCRREEHYCTDYHEPYCRQARAAIAKAQEVAP